MRPLLRLFALLVAFGVCAHAHADSLLYNLTLSPTTADSSTGIGSFTLNFAPSAVGVTTYQASDLSSFSIKFGNTFTIAGLTSLVFTDGVLSSISYSGTAGARASQSSLQISGLNYTLSGATLITNPQSGGVTAALAPTPEPNSLILLGTGLLGVAGVARRRFAQRGTRNQNPDVAFA